MDLVTAVDTVTSLINTFSSFRNEEKLTKFVQTAKEKAVQCGIEDSFRDLGSKRSRNLPHRFTDGQTLLDAAFSHRNASLAQPNLSVAAQSKFCIEFYYPVLDLLLSELRRRFSIESCEVLVQLSALNPAQWNEDNLKNVGKLAKRYSIPEEPTCQEYTLFKSSRYYRGLLEEMEERGERGWKKPYLPLILKKFGKGDLASLYPNLHRLICIAATIPVTIASCERCHSKVKIVNNYMRATMAEDRLQSLVLISSERDLAEDIKLDCLVDVFEPRNLENFFCETLLNRNINSMY